jgi:4'-phosphopantetheinyl transferase
MAPRLADPASVPLAWERPLALPRLADGELHVWRCELSDVGEQLLDALSPDERARAAGYARADRGLLWAHSRAALRALLGAYTATPPASLRFQATPDGKPALEGGPAFNLAHSGPLALYALSAAGEVGVDVELARERSNARRAGVAGRAFGPKQAAHLLGLPPEHRERELLRLWVAHEARVKHAGSGLAGATQAEVWLAELPLGDGAAAAVALASPPQALRLWQWPPSADAA